MKELAREINDIALPRIESNHVLLPPNEFYLSKNNFQVYSEDIANKLTNPTNQDVPSHLKENESNVKTDNKMIIDDRLQLKKRESSSQGNKMVLGKKKHRHKNNNKIEIKLDQEMKANFTEGLNKEEDIDFDN